MNTEYKKRNGYVQSLLDKVETDQARHDPEEIMDNNPDTGSRFKKSDELKRCSKFLVSVKTKVDSLKFKLDIAEVLAAPTNKSIFTDDVDGRVLILSAKRSKYYNPPTKRPCQDKRHVRSNQFRCIDDTSRPPTWGTLNIRRASSPLVRLKEDDERWRALTTIRLFSFKTGVEPSQIVLSPTWC
ncbi:hypothetical protein TNCV_1868551 [Trichonephila clavipes]|nr:hypothetical protein TNCV_1868551 [Trichonephila clavipes]